MALISDSIFIDFFLALIPAVYIIYWFLTNNNDYWDKRGVPNVKRGILVDSLRGKKSQGEGIFEIYKMFYGKRFAGFFQIKQPVLMIQDLELIHNVMVKDFSCFQDRGQPKVKNDPLSENLFNLRGQRWRALRYKLTPTFTTGKLKGMFEQISKCGDNMLERIDELSKEHTELESKSFLFEFTLDVISSCAFGLQLKPNSPEFEKFKTIVRKLFRPTTSVFLKFATLLLFPKLAEFLNVRPFPKEIAEYIVNLTKSNMKYRQDNNIQRNDYFQLLLTLKEQEESGKDMGLSSTDMNEDDAVINQMQYAGHSNQQTASNTKLITEDAICANSFIFLIGGSESTSSTINLTLLELSRHPNIQQRLQEEVDTVLTRHGGWTYAAVKDMTYLDQVIQEAQRFYPVLPFLMRECVESYKIPESDLVIEEGTLVCIPVCALHMDPQHYPDPDQFRPERFEGNYFKPNPCYLPYGDGPRICIAMRFAVMEVKTCVARIMSQYSVKLGSKTQIPLQFDPRSFTPSVMGGVWLAFQKRT